MNSIPILMYHNIAKPPKGKRLSSLYTHPKQFYRQMKILSLLGFKGLSMSDLEPYLSGHKVGRVCGITFDDGYTDNLTNALPTLKTFGFTASSYIVTDYIGQSNVWTQNQRVQEAPLMNEKELKTWLHEGMSVGSHTKSHAHLTQISSEQAKREIFSSKKDLEALLNVEVQDFCYPYGEFNKSVVECVRLAGFKTATTTQRGHACESSNRLKLPRVHMTKRTHLLLFLIKILTSYESKR